VNTHEHLPNALLTGEEVAAYLRIPTSTITYWRKKGEGPPAIRVGRLLRFRLSEIEEWLQAQKAS
jgi:excisionase family DNA binding protein